MAYEKPLEWSPIIPINNNPGLTAAECEWWENLSWAYHVHKQVHETSCSQWPEDSSQEPMNQEMEMCMHTPAHHTWRWESWCPYLVSSYK